MKQLKPSLSFGAFRALLVLLAFLGSTFSSSAAGLIVVDDKSIVPPDWIPPVPPRPGMPAPRVFHFAPLELASHKVDVNIRDQVARTSIEQIFYNPNPRRLEGTFLFPIPKGAQLDKFTMDIGGKPVEAELLSADKARKIYTDIVRSMKDPALLEYAGQDLYKVRIFPIEPHERKRINFSWSQVLKSDGGLVEYVYPLNTAKYSAKPIGSLSVKVDVKTKAPLKTIYAPGHSAEIRRNGENKATVGFEASNVRPDKDFQVFFASEGDDVGLSLMTHRSGDDGDGYFLLLASPGVSQRDNAIIEKDIVFVIDTSGSMANRKLAQAKKALQFCVANLNDGDRFEIVRFSTEAESLFNGLVKASPANREKADEFIEKLRPIGGTAIHDALRAATALRPDDSQRPFQVIFLTDGRPTIGETDEERIVDSLSNKDAANTRIFCFGIGHDLNTHLLDKITQKTRAYSQYVMADEDIEVKVSSFFTKIKEPVLANLKLKAGGGIRLLKTYPRDLPDLFKGEQLVVAGRYEGRGDCAIELTGTVNGRKRRFAYDSHFPGKAGRHDFIPRLWATRRVGYLLEEIRLGGEKQELKDEAAELARRYGIVTPYTAYLIVEDERRRNVPLSAQTLPQLQMDAELRRIAQSGAEDARRERSGLAAVRGSLAEQALKKAESADQGARASAKEANQSPAFSVSSPSPAAPRPSGVPPNARPSSSRNAPGGRAYATPGSPVSKPADRMSDYTRQHRFVNGRNFYLNGERWIDSETQKHPKAKRVRIRFNSDEYFDLMTQRPEIASWLALGSAVEFYLEGTIYEIHAD